MGRLSAALRAELLQQSPDVAFLLAVTIAGTTYRWGAIGEPGRIHSGTGLYEPRVISWGGSISRGVSLTETGLDLANDVEVLLDDTDRALTTILEGASRHSVRGATAVIYLASRNVSSGDWLTLYSGRVETYGQPSPLVWSVRLSPQDLPLRRESIPKVKILVSDWPTASLAVRDSPVPILYGRVSSSNGSNDGALTCFLVDSSGFRYLVCAGRAKAIDAVYKDGVIVSASNYTVTYPVVNGRTYTLIDFTSTQGSSAITCDAQGYDSVGDGTGTLLTDPAVVAKHLLVNWIYGDWMTGAWLSDSTAPVDTTSFGTTFFSDRGYQASVYISTKRRGVDVLNDLLKSFEAKACWTPDGKIALKVEDFTAWSYATDLVLREDELGGWDLSYPVAQLVDRIEMKYASTPTAGYTQRLAVSDLGTGEQAPEEIELPYSPAFYL